MAAKKSRKKKKDPVGDSSIKYRSLSLLFRNFLAVLITAVVIFLLYKNIQGYQWVWDTLLVKNLNVMKQYSDLTIEQKWAIKLGFDYRYLEFMKKNTPEDAVILMPADSVLFPPGVKSEFTKESYSVRNKAWATYFLYPRKIIYEKEINKNPLASKINYIAIANYRGYERLNYSVKIKQKYQVLPINIDRVNN